MILTEQFVGPPSLGERVENTLTKTYPLGHLGNAKIFRSSLFSINTDSSHQVYLALFSLLPPIANLLRLAF